MCAKFHADLLREQFRDVGRKLTRRARVRNRHHAASEAKPACRGPTAPRQAYNQHLLSANVHHVPTPGCKLKAQFKFLPSEHILRSDAEFHLNLSVVRANSEKTRAEIQKRAMIFDSFHPSSSKW